MLNKGKSRNQDNFSRNRKKEDQAHSNREKAMKEKLAHLHAVRLAQSASGKKPTDNEAEIKKPSK